MAITRFPALLMLFAALSFAQMQPQSAHVNLFFPHLADGGSAIQKWQTTFTFVNTSLSDASVDLFLYDDNGVPLALDFGGGASGEHHFEIKAGGTRVLRSLATAEAAVVGWAAAYTNVPVMGTVAYRYFADGVPRQEMSSQPALPTLAYFSAANARLGIALANVNNSEVRVAFDLFDSEGESWGNRAIVSVPALGHRSFILADLALQIGRSLDGFSGSVMLTAAEGVLDEFLAWTVAADEQDILSTLPPGAAAFPISHLDRLWLVHQQMLEAGVALEIIDPDWNIELDILTRDQVVSAFTRDQKTVGVSLGLSQLISDSAGEMAFLVAHELAHINQQRNGLERNELEADKWASLMMLYGGYEPYSISGALAKVQMAIEAGMTNGFDDLDNAAALQSVKERLAGAFDTLQAACLHSDQATEICDYYKALIHPNLPAEWQIAPLSARTGRPVQLQRQRPRPVVPLRARPRRTVAR